MLSYPTLSQPNWTIKLLTNRLITNSTLIILLIKFTFHYYSIENYETSLIFGSYRDNGLQSSDNEADDDDDSNDENNWRNEYPDTEQSSIDEDDMVRAMEKCDMGKQNAYFLRNGKEKKILHLDYLLFLYVVL